MRRRALWAWQALLLLAGCGSRGPADPRDGGAPLLFDRPDLEARTAMAGDCTWRREKGGWHYSAGHCVKMGPRQRMAGVWVTAFEESSFFPDRTTAPGPEDPQRFRVEIELDKDDVFRRSGHPASPGNEEAYRVEFEGRRSLDASFDCQGGASFVFIVDRLEGARYLGRMKPMPAEWWKRPQPLQPRYSGRWGRLQAREIQKCRERRG